MSLDDFFGRLTTLGPWSLRPPLGQIRRDDWNCPVQAVCLAHGMSPHRLATAGVSGFASCLGLRERVVEDLIDAADGLDATYARHGAPADELAHLRRLRARLLAACGLAA